MIRAEFLDGLEGGGVFFDGEEDVGVHVVDVEEGDVDAAVLAVDGLQLIVEAKVAVGVSVESISLRSTELSGVRRLRFQGFLLLALLFL